MNKQFVIAVCDVRCKNSKSPPLNYRCYVNDELFTERTWIWDKEYLEEYIQILAEPGKYQIKYELVNINDGELEISNLRIDQGPAKITSDGLIQINTPKQ